MEDEKRRLLTQTSPIPPEMLHQLSTDGGMEGIKNMMRSDGWDGDSPIILAVHRLDAAASLVDQNGASKGKWPQFQSKPRDCGPESPRRTFS